MKAFKKYAAYIVSAAAAVLLAAVVLPFTASAAEQSDIWQDAIEEMDAKDVAGAYQLIPEADINIWIPDFMNPVELDEEDREQGFVSAYMTEDEKWSVIIGCQHGENIGLDELIKILSLEEYGYSYDVQEINGIELLVFISDEEDTANVVFALNDGGFGYVIFTPFSDDEFMGYAENIYLTIRPAVSLHWSDFESALEWIGIAGEFNEFSEAGFKLWLPNYMEAYDLTEEDRAEGFIGYFTGTDTERVIAVQQIPAAVLASPEKIEEGFGLTSASTEMEDVGAEVSEEEVISADNDSIEPETSSIEITPITDEVPNAAAASMFADLNAEARQHAESSSADTFMFTFDYYRNVLDEYGASDYIDLEVNDMPALYYEIKDEDTATVSFLNAVGDLVEITYYPVSDEDFSTIIALSAASIQPPQTMSWKDSSTALSLSGIKGEYYVLEEAGMKFWLPEEFHVADFLDDLRQYAYIGYFVTSDEDAAFAMQYLDTGGMTLDDYAKFVARMGGEDISFVNINGINAISYMITTRDTKGISFVDSDGYLLEFSFTPATDEKYSPYFSVIASSIQFE